MTAAGRDDGRPRASFHVGDPNAPAPNRPRRLGVSFVPVDEAGRVLLEHRSDSDLWGLLGGGVDDEESLVAAVRREVREETGLEIARLELAGVFSDPTRIMAYPDGAVLRSVTTAFVGVLAAGGIRLSEESVGARWFAWDEVPWTRVPATQVAILQHVERWLAAEPAERRVHVD